MTSTTRKPLVVLGFLGSTLDAGVGPKRWSRWRPTVSLCRHPDMIVDRIELIHGRSHTSMAKQVIEDIEAVSPTTQVRPQLVELADPWDFEEVFGQLLDFASNYPFDTENEDYLLHITTGTHVAQICMFLLTESRRIPARLLQGSPPPKLASETPGTYRIIDLDLSRYDQLAARFQQEQREGVSLLKSGIETANEVFNRLIDRIERVALASTAPILLTGPTGAGKTQLARQIYELKRRRRQFEGKLVEVNCATIRGDGAMSALFGHRRGAFTGAIADRPGLLLAAHSGLLFLDEIGELGLDEQAMLLRALESRTFLPVGSDKEVQSDFQLIAGTNRDLRHGVAEGTFREDLLARIDLWTFTLPGLCERPEDIAPNIDYELARFGQQSGAMVRFNRQAHDAYLDFATSPAARWAGSFRDLNGSITRMATLAGGGRIDEELVGEEIQNLQGRWQERPNGAAADAQILDSVLGPDAIAALDRFDAVQLADVIAVCRQSRTLSEAGRTLFAVSRTQKASNNDADRLRKYLARFDLSWQDL